MKASAPSLSLGGGLIYSPRCYLGDRDQARLGRAQGRAGLCVWMGGCIWVYKSGEVARVAASAPSGCSG